jgi:hypothetical protein
MHKINALLFILEERYLFIELKDEQKSFHNLIK